MKKIDCFGDFCPIPLLKAQEACRELAVGERFMLVTDHSCTAEALEDHFSKSRYRVTYEEVINGVWEITITRTR